MAVASSSQHLFQPPPSATPHESLWFEVLRRLHTDLAAQGRRGKTIYLTSRDLAQLDFIADAIKSSRNLREIMRDAEEKYEMREMKRKLERKLEQRHV